MPSAPPPHSRPPQSTQLDQDWVEELLAMLVHELRRPLTALLGALATIQQRGPALPVAQQQELLTMARRQGAQLQRLLEHLLVAATPDQPQLGRDRSLLVDAAVVATEAGMAARLAHPHHRITIEVAEPLLVRADPLAISCILGNLLDNAATHAPAGAPIQLIGSHDGTQVVLAVQDQGPGVAAEASERIFERYARVARRGGPAVGGLGLGLYISRRLARANGGDLRLSPSTGGRGACFELRLPMAQPGADPHSGTAPPGACGEEP